jgi:hypothetical protein
MTIALRLAIQLPLTIAIAFSMDIALTFQMLLMLAAMRKLRLSYSYTVGPWPKVLLIFAYLTPINLGIAFPKLPDIILGPSILILATTYAAYVGYLCSRGLQGSGHQGGPWT